MNPKMKTPTKITTKTAPKTTAKPGAPTTPTVGGPIGKIITLRRWAATRVVGRSAEIDLVTLALVARVNVLLLGVPGTAKTMLVSTLSSSFTKGSDDFFDVLMTKFTKPAEVFGPTDVVALRDESTLRVATAGFLPVAKVGFLDEIFKASSAILNSLLRIANERTFRNGSEWERCPTRMLVGASNEMPEDATLLAAFYDRFPLKSIVNPLEDSAFGDMVRLVAGGAAPTGCPVSFTDEDFEQIDRQVDAVVLPNRIVEALTQLRCVLRAKGITPSDRRWAQSIRILKASAAISGRSDVSRSDLTRIESVLWSAKEEIGTVKTSVADFLSPIDRVLRENSERAFAARKEVLDAAGHTNDAAAAAVAATRALSSIRGAEALLDKIEETIVETDEDREKIVLARESIANLGAVVAAVCTGTPDAIAKLREASN